MEAERRKSLSGEMERQSGIMELKDLRRRMSQVKEEDKKFYAPLGPTETLYLPTRHLYVKALNYPTKFLRRMQLGIECPTYLEWRHWYPGEKNRKSFVVKNVGRRTLTFQWKPPASQHFLMEFKEPARLSPGTSATMDIVFRPTQLVNYKSSVEFVTAKWKWTLILKGSLPQIDLGFPKAFDFGYCTVNEFTDKKYQVTNNGDVPVAYQWNVRLPFHMIPEAGTILPKDSASLVCRFNPKDASAYISKAFVTTSVGSTTEVRMTGIGKFPVLSLSPGALVFGHVLVNSSKDMQMVVTNTSIVPAMFWVRRAENDDHFGASSVFSIHPTEGTIGPTSCITLKVCYTPVCAGTFSLEQFEIVVNTTSRVCFSCSGTAARPAVMISTFSMDFGSLELGDTVARAITLDNQSDVPVNFQFVPEGGVVFEFVTDRGTIRAKRPTTVTIHFKPIEARNYYQRVFCVIQDNYPLYCDFIGTCFKETLRQPTLMQYHVDQHRAYVKTAIAHQLEAIQYEDQDKDDFVETAHAPKKPRPVARVSWGNFCSLGTDLINVGHALILPHIKRVDITEDDGMRQVKVALDLERKSTISFRDIGPRCSNTYVQNVLEPSKKVRQNSYVLTDEMPGPGDFASLDTNIILGNNKGLVLKHKQIHLGKEDSAQTVWEELFVGRMVDWEPVTIDVSHLDFGAGSSGEMSEVKHITLTNNSDTLLTCLWLVETPPEDIPPRLKQFPVIKVYGAPVQAKPEEKDPVFQVFPRRVDIPMGAAFTFSATFAPIDTNAYYSQLLTVLVYDNCDLGAKQCAISPPWSGAVQVSGHSFHFRSQEFVPLGVSFHPEHIFFRAVLINHPVYQNTTLYNKAKTPLRFAFNCDELLPEFSLVPSEGVIPGESLRIITFKFESKTTKVYQNKVTCIFNNAVRDFLVVSLTASTHLPKVKVEDDSCMCFKPTSIGTRVLQTFVMYNTSGIPSQYQWDIPPKYKDIFAMDNPSGLIRGKEKIYLNCSFSPRKKKHYTCNISCITAACTEKAYYSNNAIALQTMPSTEYFDTIKLVAHGEGIVDTIRIRPEVLDLGIIVVGIEKKVTVSLYNPSEGGLQYELKLRSPEDESIENLVCIIFDTPSAFIPARSFQTVAITVKTIEPVTFSLEVVCTASFPDSYEILPAVPGIPRIERNYEAQTDSVDFDSCFSVDAIARYPALKIVGVKSEDMSGAQLWREIRVSTLNHILSTDKVKGKSLFCMGATLTTMTPFILEFGARSMESKPTTVHFAVKSRGGLPAIWKVRIWNDREADTENWVREGDPSPEETEFLDAKVNRLFEVEPREGRLKPGDVQFIKFTYKHSMEGTHILPILLEVNDGRTTPINLSGKTLPNPPPVWTWESAKYSHAIAPADTHYLQPVALGDNDPPLQTVELRNNGDSDICYTLDLSPLDDMEEQNWGFQVLACLNPAGSIPAREFILLNFLFRPLEAKQYEARIPVTVEGHEAGLIFLKAIGYHGGEDCPCPPERNQPKLSENTTFEWPGDSAKLSTEFINFGRIEELSWNRKMVAVKNLLQEERIAFFWQNNMATEAMVHGEFSVVPSYGVLEPGHSCICKVIFGAGVRAQAFQTTLRCDIELVPPEIIAEPKVVEEPKEEIIVNNWKRLGSNSYNKAFARKSSLVALTENTARRLPLLAERIMAREQLELSEASRERTYSGALALKSVLYLTVAAEIFIKDQFHRTADEKLTNATADAPEQTSMQLQDELVQKCLLELLQESLEKEMLEPGFDNIDPHLHMFNEELKARPNVSAPPEDPVDSLKVTKPEARVAAGGGTPKSPKLHPSFAKPSDDKLGTQHVVIEQLVHSLDKAEPENLSSSPLAASASTSGRLVPWSKHGQVHTDDDPISSLETLEMVDFLLEGTLFNLVKEIYEHDQ